MVVKTHPSIEEFYNGAPPEERRLSPEVDFGDLWTDVPNPFQITGTLPCWRVSWVVNTGEVYAVESRSGEVRVYGVIEGRERVESYLCGWAEHCGVGGLAWISGRVSPLFSMA